MSDIEDEHTAKPGTNSALIDHEENEVDELEKLGQAYDQRPPKKRVKFAERDDVKEVDFAEESEQFPANEDVFEPFHMENERSEGWFSSFGSGKDRDRDTDDEDEAWLKDIDNEVVKATERGDPFQKPVKRAVQERHLQSSDPVEIRMVLLQYLEEGENVLRALRRLGKRGSDGKIDEANKKALDVVTEAADALMEQGHYDVYQDTHAVLQRFVDKASGTSSARKRPREETQWEFKWSKDAEEVYGPYSSSHMTEWKKQGYFVGDRVAFVRTCQTPAADWTLSSNISSFEETDQ